MIRNDDLLVKPADLPTISVALATYNGSRHLVEQLDSITSQTYPPVEIVASDDRSSDDTVSIIKEYARRSPVPIRVIQAGKHRNFSDNFLFAASKCVSPFVAFSDQDDVWQPRKLELGLARMLSVGSLLSIHRSIFTDAQLAPCGTLDQGITSDRDFKRFELDPYINGWGNTMLFSRSLLSAISADLRPSQPEDIGRPLSHDTWIYTLAAALGSVSHLHDALCLYRQHENNVSGTVISSKVQRLRTARIAPLSRFRARRDFAEHMADLFEQQVGTEMDDGRFRTAADMYRVRAKVQEARLAIYEHPSALGRAANLVRHRKLARADPAHANSALSLAKDAALGVLALGVRE